MSEPATTLLLLTAVYWVASKDPMTRKRDLVWVEHSWHWRFLFGWMIILHLVLYVLVRVLFLLLVASPCCSGWNHSGQRLQIAPTSWCI